MQNPVGYTPYRPLTKKKMDQHGRFNPKQPMPAKHLPSLRHPFGKSGEQGKLRYAYGMYAGGK